MYGRGKVWPYMAMFAAIIVVSETVTGWHGISVVALIIVALVGLSTSCGRQSTSGDKAMGTRRSTA